MVRVPAFMMVVAALIIFLANAGSLVLQLLAGRYLAPFIGSSVETWTSVIGVFLTGIALGNAVGGRIADKYPSTRTLAGMLILGAICSLTMLLGMRICNATDIHQNLPLWIRIPALAFAFCLAPAFILSLITPLTIKLMISDVRNAGRITGLIFALSTLGCLLGNYLTGFYFMADYTLDQISLGVAASLAVLGFLTLLIGYHAPREEKSDQLPEKMEDSMKNHLWQAYAIVFTASFCGMSLELTASRYLAPILGVSLYSWTGIIGVMLAGTALGNFCGGIIADRGKLLTRLAQLAIGNRLITSVLLFSLGAIIGLAIAPLAVERIQKMANIQIPMGYRINLICAGCGGLLLTMLLLPTTEEKIRMLKNGIARTHILSTTLLCAGLATICILAITAILQQMTIYENQMVEPPFGKPFYVTYGYVETITQLVGHDLVRQIVGWTFALFFIPMFLLGMISPQVIRMSVPDISHVGRVAGSVYAVSTFGAIVGTFVTGYFLIASLGTWSMILLIALVLSVLAALVGKLWKNSVLLFVGSIVIGAACFGMMLVPSISNRFDLETRYYAIRVNYNSEYHGRAVASLSLDHLSHSFVDIDDPSFLGYTHEEIQGELLRLALDHHPDTKCLVIGGGGYTFPRWVDYTLPEVHTDVVEIDPGVTRIAYEKLALSSRRIEVGYLLGSVGVVLSEQMKLRRPSQITPIHMDGRQYVSEKAQKGYYHLIMQDAVNDLSVPYHLMTREYNDALKKILAPDGVYLLTLIDSVRDGVLWRAAVRTMRETYKYVYLIDSVPFYNDRGEHIMANGRHVLIVYGADQPIDLNGLHAVLRKKVASRLGGQTAMGVGALAYPSFTYVLDSDKLEAAMTTPVKKAAFGNIPILLRDQYAPVDNLMSGVFRDREEPERD